MIEEIFPEFGPKSGGTVLTIRGAFLDAGNKREVTVGNAVCKIQRSVYGCFSYYNLFLSFFLSFFLFLSTWHNTSFLFISLYTFFTIKLTSTYPPTPFPSLSSTMLICKTPPSPEPSNQPVTLTMDGVERRAPVPFTYNQDPVINGIQPSRSFIRSDAVHNAPTRCMNL